MRDAITNELVRYVAYLRPRNVYVSVPEARSERKILHFSGIDIVEIDIVGYADDNGLVRSFTLGGIDKFETIQSLQDCLTGIHQWMISNRLKLNRTKTKFVFFGSRTQLSK